IHDWPVKLSDPPPSINFYPVQINLSKTNTELSAKSTWDVNGDIPDNKSYNQDILLFDFGIFGATDWETVIDNYDSFTISTNSAKIRIWDNVQGNIIELFNDILGINREIKIKDINYCWIYCF
ncbi:hypothetical protein, partial [Spiroplasma phoeniceum]|uniref:hypothetical protein n=1 Tax=Spiroplasma phoeniceum TaxID=47835 RepID=UPI003365079E